MEKPHKTKVKKSKTGLGLYADEPIKNKALIIEYLGKIISNDQADKKQGKYLFNLNSRVTLDGSSRKNKARYINHTCENPNAEAIQVGKRIFIYAKKNILPGEEIFYNYGKEYYNGFLKGICSCPKCVKGKRKKTA